MKPSTQSRNDPLSRSPTTGIADCCARAASGHAATAPPSATRNSRRPMVTVIRPSRARCVRGTIPRHERAVLTTRHPAQVGPTLGTVCNRAPPGPTQLPAKSAFFVSAVTIADAVAELVSYLSIVPHMRSSDVPPKHSAPLTRGIFSVARLPASRTAAEPVAKSRANLSKKAPLGRGRVLRDERCGISATRPNWADENVPIRTAPCHGIGNHLPLPAFALLKRNVES